MALVVVRGYTVCGTVRTVEVQVTGDGEREDYVGIGVYTNVLLLERERRGREGGREGRRGRKEGMRSMSVENGRKYTKP